MHSQPNAGSLDGEQLLYTNRVTRGIRQRINETCSELLPQLQNARLRLQEQGVLLARGGRLDRAEEVLTAIAGNAELPTQPVRQAVHLNAIHVAFDFVDIASVLPPERVAKIRKELTLAVRGSLEQDETDRQPYQYQSQYWFATVLQRAGLAWRYPSVRPREKRKSPDFLVENGACRYGIEVNRPVRAPNVGRSLEEAVAQLAHQGVSGVIAIDVSDCLRDLPESDFQDGVWAIGNTLDDTVWNSGTMTYRGGMDRVMGLFTFARGAWVISDSQPLLVSMLNASASTVFSARRRTLLDHHGIWIREKTRGAAGSLPSSRRSPVRDRTGST